MKKRSRKRKVKDKRADSLYNKTLELLAADDERIRRELANDILKELREL